MRIERSICQLTMLVEGSMLTTRIERSMCPLTRWMLTTILVRRRLWSFLVDRAHNRQTEGRKEDCRCYDSGAGLRLKESFKRSVFDTLVRAVRKSRMRRAGQMQKAHRSIPNGLHVAAFLEPAPLESLHGKQSLHGLQKDGGQLCIPPSLWVNADYRPFTHRLPSY